ncbi:MAG TPA: acyclic terpene utilization AtuA family protein [Acidimicrobiia bacterium]|nr:acyclic terpene utilization AtuA family protein [Acidimicrobiia bacterium]
MPEKVPAKVVVSGAAGAWGDSSLSTPQLLADGRSDYIVYEGLAEITMAILSRARSDDPGQGFARDIVEVIAANLSGYRDAGMRVVTNAGGVNPGSAAELIKRADPTVRVATVSGDDLMGSDTVEAAGLSGRPLSANAYLGARPIAAALDAGADVVVTGRVVDSALVLGPLIHEFGWGPDRLDLLSAGSLAGHLLECGPQSTGGLLTDWEDTTSWANPGYPIAEVAPDGRFVLTAPDGTDALVDLRTVGEQLLYEIGDPSAYLLPDVTCDWTDVTIQQVGPNRVAVSGARGLAPPPTLKACAQIPDGWRAQVLLFIGGRDAGPKARRVGADLLERGDSMLSGAGLGGFEAVSIEVLGAEDTYGPHARADSGREVVLKIAVHHRSREAVAAFVREIPSIALAGPPGVSGGGSGLARPTPLIRLECFPVSREAIEVVVDLDGTRVPVDPEEVPTGELRGRVVEASPKLELDDVTVPMPLLAIAHGRSGDKGGDVNIGIRARHPDLWPVLLRELTAERVAGHLGHLEAVEVLRYELRGIHALNFLLVGGLGAGGTASLRFDPQGKAVAQQLLDMEVAVPASLAGHPSLRAL